MPYLSCPGCGLTLYSASAYSTTDDCPRCSSRLRSVRRPPRVAPPDHVHQALDSARSTLNGPVSELEVNARIEPFGMHVEVSGALVYPDTPRLDSVLEAADPRPGRLVVDLRAMTDLDSSGIATLMSAFARSRRVDFALVVVAPAPRHRRLFELTGVDKWLTLVDDLAAATGDLPRQPVRRSRAS